MDYYDDPKNVEDYIRMCQGYDGSELYAELAKLLPEQSRLLELGSGGGSDLGHLSNHYQVTGSDLSDAFLDHCRAAFPHLSFLKLNATQLDLNERYECIFSNKVLHHLSQTQLQHSLQQQSKILDSKGLIAHSFWLGDEDQHMHGMLFSYYKIEQLRAVISENFEILSVWKYSEFERDDSAFIIARKKA
ncbi:class I SAM-dependent methyltransferase [Alginatibacterium sediminis]|uniref:Class I SAM-dependent methyltransferase n=1 Tax=Alginatibacterium sediminis TaxID=2164068 RepID=A0A420E9Q4_9ALTE|nr:class I SAM-dependent methyltransferase [Alginatibacterium sediminis]RKF17409.1 class I SAM-dependent methyltransferase [Alginatibacterium sediminis]